MTFDQIYVLTAPKSEIAKLGGLATMSVQEAKEAGVKKSPPANAQGASLVQRIRARKAIEREAAKVQQHKSKRQRIREQGEAIKAARARGEKI